MPHHEDIEWFTMKTAGEFSTPMMRQYSAIKSKYDDCLLFFRLGDFYELFLEDAVVGSKVLNIVLTKRPRGKDGDIPMAGVPFHSADSYISKLVKAGYKVAICEQTSEPDSKGIVDREVVRIVTPGTIMDEQSLVTNQSNYIMALSYDSESLGLAFLDISTGSFQVTQCEHDGQHRELLAEEIRRFLPSECILSRSQYADHTLLKTISSVHDINIYDFPQWDEYGAQPTEKLQQHFNVQTLQGFGIHHWLHAQYAASALLGYVEHTQRTQVGHIVHIASYHPQSYVKLDESTIRNLELFSTLHGDTQSGSFINVVDTTQTPMGGRLLREWIQKPLINIDEIIQRQQATQTLIDNKLLCKALTEKLKDIRDIERLTARISVRLGNARDLNYLKDNVEKIVEIKKIIPTNTSLLKKIHTRIHSKQLIAVMDAIRKTISENPPQSITEGSMIRANVNPELDELRAILSQGTNWIESFEKEEREKTKIPTLRVRFNTVFGYYIEISKPHIDKVPSYYQRKQTMVSAERYITEELKNHETKILAAEEKIQKLEYKLFHEVVSAVMRYVADIQAAANAIAEIDCLAANAQNALTKKYICPTLSDNKVLHIHQGRHPIVENVVAKGEFVPNDTLLDNAHHQLIILTGPNMAGKSVYIRQVALITLMAHVGMFVPADKAEISIVDRIFVRSGASDMISSGLSTFMVEMVETANILNHATDNSLIIMDEVGRGTSTYDGISIASAVVEYLVTQPQKRAKTLFATHYHELQDLENKYPDRVKNYQVAITEHNNDIIFLHSVIPGKASHSFGVAVAKKAGVPKIVTDAAEKYLHSMEKRVKKASTHDDSIKTRIETLDIDSLTPIKALQLLAELKQMARNE